MFVAMETPQHYSYKLQRSGMFAGHDKAALPHMSPPYGAQERSWRGWYAANMPPPLRG